MPSPPLQLDAVAAVLRVRLTKRRAVMVAEPIGPGIRETSPGNDTPTCEGEAA